MFADKTSLCIFHISFIYFSIVFWLGDLNYRIDMDINEVKDLVSKGALNKLLPKDQVCLFLYKEVNFPNIICVFFSFFKQYLIGDMILLCSFYYDMPFIK